MSLAPYVRVPNTGTLFRKCHCSCNQGHLAGWAPDPLILIFIMCLDTGLGRKALLADRPESHCHRQGTLEEAGEESCPEPSERNAQLQALHFKTVSEHISVFLSHLVFVCCGRSRKQTCIYDDLLELTSPYNECYKGSQNSSVSNTVET